MTEETLEKNKKGKSPDDKKVGDAESESVSTAKKAEKGSSTDSAKRSKKPFKKNIRRSRRGRKKPARDFESKIVSIRRVTRVVAGGRRFSFSVAMVAGDKKGSVGVGHGKASDTALAIEKAMRRAKKNMITLELTDENSIPFEVASKYTASRVEMRPALGRGLSAGSSVRAVLELGGVNDVTAKILSRSKNQLNNARAAIKALKKIGYKRYETKKKMAERKAPGDKRKQNRRTSK